MKTHKSGFALRGSSKWQSCTWRTHGKNRCVDFSGTAELFQTHCKLAFIVTSLDAPAIAYPAENEGSYFQ